MKQEPKRRYETDIPLRPASIEEAGLFYSQADLAGRVSYADGTTQAFTDPRQYLQTIREELPFRNTTGFRYETLTADPQVQKEVDDIILDFAGEENPRRACGYGLTEKGLQALRDAADPTLPHTYAWFVLTDCNTPQEQIHRGLTLDEAIRLYQDSPGPRSGWALPRIPLPRWTLSARQTVSRASSRTIRSWTASGAIRPYSRRWNGSIRSWTPLPSILP